MQSKKRYVQVANPKTLGTDSIVVERIALGQPNDYKPCIAELPSGELLIVAFHHSEKGGRLYEDILIFRSKDGGKTWSKPAVHKELLGREPYLSVLKDGTLLMTVHHHSRDHRNKDGYIKSYIHRSVDAGRTWNTTSVTDERIPSKTWTHTTRNVLELPDGSLLFGFSALRHDLNFIWRSFDKGTTWTEKYAAKFIDLREDYPGLLFAEMFLWQAKSGKLYGIARVDPSYFPPLPASALPGENMGIRRSG